ncbi:MAG: OsmC family protein [Actinobacteria bacterium]|nr:OsmC family protein [Actinomycetota bacterium]
MSESIRDAIESAIEYLGAHPDEARYTDSLATATLVEGLRVRVEGPDGASVETDMPTSVGGSNTAQSPGWFFRASLASCVATLVAMRSAQEGVALSSLQVDVDSESDDRGILGMDPSVPAGPLSVSIRVRAESDAAPERMRAIVESAVEHCPVTDATKREVAVVLDFSG